MTDVAYFSDEEDEQGLNLDATVSEKRPREEATEKVDGL